MYGTSIYYDAMLYLYALSLLFMFSDFANRNLRAKQIGTGLLAFVWMLQTVYLFYEASRMPADSLFELFSSMFFISWLIISLSLLLNYLMRVDVLFIVNLAGLAIAALGFFGNRAISGAVLEWQVSEDLLFIHISLAVASYSVFLISAVLSTMILFIYGRLKSRRWTVYLSRMPSLEVIHKLVFMFVIVGTSLLISSLVLGLVWIAYGQQWQLFLDWKVINSILILLIYSYYIWQRVKGVKTWSYLAIINLVGFLAVISNFVLSNSLSRFH
jgi:HemX protein